MALRVRVCALDEIAENELQSFEVPGVAIPILVTMVNGEIIAGTSMCPHEDVSLVRGSIRGKHIVCSAHGYRFDLHSGQCAHDPTLRWRLYKTSIQSGQLYVDLA